MQKQYFIYITTNIINGKKYIGKHYGYPDDNYLGSGKILRRAIQKYGKENFQRQIIDFSSTEDENCEKEKYYIALFDACHNDLFYNIHEGGNGGNTTEGYTLEQKQALSKKFSIITSGKNNPMYGIKRPEEYKKFMSYYASNIRDNSVYRTQEYRDNMSKLTSGKNNGMYGKHHTEESKAKMSLRSKGKTAGSKNGMYGKKGMNAINGKSIIMLDKDYNIEQIFPSISAVLDFLQIKGHTKLYEAMRNNIFYRGHYWKKQER